MLRSLVLIMLAVFVLVGCGVSNDSKVAGVVKHSHSFLPENNLWQEDGIVDNGMTEETFNAIINSVTVYFEPIVQKLGGNLIVEKNFDDSTVNAYADRSGNDWQVHMFGGLARRSEITHDGFAMVLSHEIGHHLGGMPFVSDWAANEGEADTFAFLSAAKIIWNKSINDTADEATVDPTAKGLCDKYRQQDKAICYRQMNAAYSLANLLGALGGTKVSFKTPDKAVVKKTYNEHPAAQCRLDTYVAGTLCDVAWNSDIIPQTESEARKQSCFSASSTTYDIKARPRCWFHPSK